MKSSTEQSLNEAERGNKSKPLLGDVFPLEQILSDIKKTFNWVSSAFIENGEIIIEEDYEMSDCEKNDDDCYDTARENGETIIEKFTKLEISNYYCHRHKYAIVHLRIIGNIA